LVKRYHRKGFVSKEFAEASSTERNQSGLWQMVEGKKLLSSENVGRRAQRGSASAIGRATVRENWVYRWFCELVRPLSSCPWQTGAETIDTPKQILGFVNTTPGQYRVPKSWAVRVGVVRVWRAAGKRGLVCRQVNPSFSETYGLGYGCRGA